MMTVVVVGLVGGIFSLGLGGAQTDVTKMKSKFPAERELLASLGGVWIDSTETKWTQIK